MALSIGQFSSVQTGALKLGGDGDAPALKTVGSTPFFGRAVTWFQGKTETGRTENRAVTQAFAESLKSAYGEGFTTSVAGRLNVDSGKPLTARTVQAFVAEGKAAVARNDAFNNATANQFAHDVTPGRGNNFSGVFSEAARAKGFAPGLAALNTDRLQRDIGKRILQGGGAGKNIVSTGQAHAAAQKEIGEFIDKKQELLTHLDTMGLSANDKALLTDFALKHDIRSGVTLEQTWALRGDVAKLATVFSNPAATSSNHVRALADFQRGYDVTLAAIMEGIPKEDFGADDIVSLAANSLDVGFTAAGMDAPGAQKLLSNLTSAQGKELRENLQFLGFNSVENGIGQASVAKLGTMLNVLQGAILLTGERLGHSQDQVIQHSMIPDSISRFNDTSDEITHALRAGGLRDVPQSARQQVVTEKRVIDGEDATKEALAQVPNFDKGALQPTYTDERKGFNAFNPDPNSMAARREIPEQLSAFDQGSLQPTYTDERKGFNAFNPDPNSVAARRELPDQLATFDKGTLQPALPTGRKEMDAIKEEISGFSPMSLNHVSTKPSGFGLEETKAEFKQQALNDNQAVRPGTGPTAPPVGNQPWKQDGGVLLNSLCADPSVAPALAALTGATDATRDALLQNVGTQLAAKLDTLSKDDRMAVHLTPPEQLLGSLTGALGSSVPPGSGQKVLTALLGGMQDRFEPGSKEPDVPANLVLGGKAYRFERDLNQGSFGKVSSYRGDDGERLAVKTHLYAGCGEADMEAEAFETQRGEAITHRTLMGPNGTGHPNLAELKGAVQGPDGSLRIALEFAPGGNVRSLLERLATLANAKGPDGQPVLDPRALQIALKTLMHEAIAAHDHIHDMGVTNLDSKPDNLLIGRGGRVKATDFGTSKEATTFNISEPVGTQTYMAPEVINTRGLQRIDGTDSSPVSTKADIFSLGTMFQETFFGARSLDGESARSTLPQRYAVSGSPLRPRLGDQPGFGALDKAVNTMMHGVDGQRPDSKSLLGLSMFKDSGVNSADAFDFLEVLGDKDTTLAQIQEAGSWLKGYY